jgi:hypothetical protein
MRTRGKGMLQCLIVLAHAVHAALAVAVLFPSLVRAYAVPTYQNTV